MKLFFITASLVLGSSNVYAGNIVESDLVSVNTEEVEAYLYNRIPASQIPEFLAKPRSMQDLVESQYSIKVLAQKALEAGYADVAYIEQQLEVTRDRLLSNQFLAKYTEEQLAKVDWGKLAEEHYIANKNEYNSPEKVRASHILVSTNDKTEEEALAIINDISDKLSNGKAFAALALEYSDDPSAKVNAGSLGVFSRGKMVKPFEEVVFKMRKKGDVTGPVKTQFGYHLIQLNDYFAPALKAFEDVSEEITSKLRSEAIQNLRADLLIKIRSDQSIKWNKELLEKTKANLLESTNEIR